MSSFRKFYRPPSAARQDLVPEEVHGAYKKKIDPSYMDQEGRGTLHLSLMHQTEDPGFIEHVIRVGGCDVNAPDKHGCRPVAYAARVGAVRSLRVILMHGARLDDLDHAGLSAMMTAASHSQWEALEQLLRAGATVNLTNDKGENALHYAVGADCVNCVRSLLKYGCRINQQDKVGQTVLHLAARAGNDSMLTTLLTFHCHGKAQLNLQDMHGRTAVHWAIDSGSELCLQVLLQHAADTSVFDKHHNSAVLLAIKGNKPGHLSALLSASSRRMTIDGRSPVAIAALLGHTECVRLLLDSGLDPNLSGHFDQTPLICAAFECRLDIMDLLISRGANPSGLTDTTALLAALSCINKDNVLVRHTVVAKLISAGADPNIKFARSWYFNPILKSLTSPLSLAFTSGYKSFIGMLLTAGCLVSNSDLSSWFHDDTSHDCFDRKDLLQPIKEFLSQPLPLTLQIRILVRKQITPGNLEKKIQSLPIAPGLMAFLLFEDLLYVDPELAQPVPRSVHTVPSVYHPFREGQSVGVMDLAHGGALEGTLLHKTLLSAN